MGLRERVRRSTAWAIYDSWQGVTKIILGPAAEPMAVRLKGQGGVVNTIGAIIEAGKMIFEAEGVPSAGWTAAGALAIESELAWHETMVVPVFRNAAKVQTSVTSAPV